MTSQSRRPLGRILSFLLVLTLVVAFVVPNLALAVREDTTTITPSDSNGDGKNDTWDVDWDGDGDTDETWRDTDGDGTVDQVEYPADSPAHSPRGQAGTTYVDDEELEGGGSVTVIDWDGDGDIDEAWWDFDGDGVIDDTDIYDTESCLVDNTRSRTFRGVFVGNNQDLKYAEKDAKDVKETLEGYTDSWDPANMDLLTGNAATPAGIQAAIDAAKADSKPGDEFVFYFSGHGGGYDKDDGYAGGVVDHVDTDETNADDKAGDERAIGIPEDELEMDGSGLGTPAPGFLRGYFHDMDGDGTEDTAVVRDSAGNVSVRRFNPAPPPGNWSTVIGTDSDGDGDVDEDDGGIDYNNDGDKSDTVYFDDTLQASDGAGGSSNVTDDQLTTWLSGFPQSVTINVILDSCYSGSFIPDLKNNLKDKDGKPLLPGHLEVITAAPADDTAWEKPISHGVMTAGLLAGLKPIPESYGFHGHTTTLADILGGLGGTGATDDITTTRELFNWAGANSSNFHLGDDDGDGPADEDGVEHQFGAQTRNTANDTTSGVVSVAHHAPDDDDGDLKYDEDPPVPPDSFFDVYYDPDFLGEPTPTFLQHFGGDDALSATGMLPGCGFACDDSGILPGKLLRVSIRQLSDRYVNLVLPSPPPGLEYASDVYDISLAQIETTPSLSTTATADLAKANMTVTPVPLGLAGTDVTATLGVGEWVPPGLGAAAAPHYFDEELTGEWVEYGIDGYSYDPVGNRIDFDPNHLSIFALFYPGPGKVDTMPPGPVTRLRGYFKSGTMHLAWSNPTDSDWARTKVLHSTTGYATAHDDAGFDVVYSGRTPFDTETRSTGTHYYTAFGRDWTGNWSTRKTAKVVVERTFTPVQGDDRYETAVAASNEAFPTGIPADDPEGRRSVVVATGENWPDALGGSALAGALGGPILLTRTGYLPPAVAEEIVRLGADRVFVIGGTAAVSGGVAAALRGVKGVTTVERIAGANRYETADAVAKRTAGLLPSYDGNALLATGANFPDALAAAPLAAGLGWPLFLTDPSTLPPATKAAMQSIGASNCYVLGGTAAVSAGVMGAVGAMPGTTVSRLAGDDRYATAAAVAAQGVTSGLGWDGLGVATGENFPDALSGGVMLGRNGAVMLLTPSSSLATAAQGKLVANKAVIFDVAYLGGPSAVSQTVRNQVAAALQ